MKTSTSQGSDTSTDTGGGDTLGSTSGTATGTDSATGTSTGTALTNYNYGGAQVGQPSDQQNVLACLVKGTFFDRFSGDSGTCTELPLAKMDCTDAGIRAILSQAQVTQYNQQVTGAYSGWMIDQCVDCPLGGGSPTCTSSSNQPETGTKVFFVQASNSEIQGKAMVLPLRPGHGGAPAGVPSGVNPTPTSLPTGSATGTSTGT